MGPEPTTIYWQRRAVAVAVLLVLVLVLRWLVGAVLGSDTVVSSDSPPPPAASTAAGASAAASAEPSASPTVAACAPAALQLTATAGAATYVVGDRPELELTVTSSAASPCSRDVGQAAVEVLIFSGSDRIWSSDDCASGGPSKVTTLERGVPVAVKVTWSGSRSLPGCSGPQSRAVAGTYRVSARVGELSIDGGTFRLTS